MRTEGRGKRGDGEGSGGGGRRDEGDGTRAELTPFGFSLEWAPGATTENSEHNPSLAAPDRIQICTISRYPHCQYTSRRCCRLSQCVLRVARSAGEHWTMLYRPATTDGPSFACHFTPAPDCPVD